MNLEQHEFRKHRNSEEDAGGDDMVLVVVVEIYWRRAPVVLQ